MYSSILVPIDGSAQSRKALEVAIKLIDPEQGKLYLLNVQEPPHAQDTLGSVGAQGPNAEKVLQEKGMAVINRVCEEIGLDTQRVQRLVHEGQPPKMIVPEAKRLGVAAIVIGSRGVSDMASLVLGSVSHRVLHLAPCSVIVVH